MPRYVVLTHDHPFLHWDLLLEPEGKDQSQGLRTWRLLSEPDTGDSIPAEKLPDHRRMYLDYEGPVSGNRGEVRRWDTGNYECVGESAAEGPLRFLFRGGRLTGAATLVFAGDRWVFEMEVPSAAGADAAPL